MDKENKKRKGTKRRSKNSEETLKQCEDNKETEDEIIHPPRRRSARLIAISKPDKGFGDGKGSAQLEPKETKKNGILDGIIGPPLHSPIASFADQKTLFPSDRPLIDKATNLGEGTSQTDWRASSDDDGEDEWGAMELLPTQKIDQKVIEVQLDEKHSDLFKRRMNPLEERNAKMAEERAKWEREMGLEIKRKRRELQEGLHRVHFLSFMAHLRFMADSLLRNSDNFQKQFTVLFGPMSAPFTPLQMSQFLLKEFRGKFDCKSEETLATNEPSEWCIEEDKFVRHLLALANRGFFVTDREIALLFFVLCSLMKLRARICVAFNPMPKLLVEPNTVSKEIAKKGKENPSKVDDEKDLDEQFEGKRRRPKGKGRTETKKEKQTDQVDNRSTAYWNEYWDEVERRWICVDSFHCRVDEPDQIELNFGFSTHDTHKILYVLAIDNKGGIREIGAKYIGDFLSSAIRKLRTDDKWIKQTMELKPFFADANCCRLEDAQIYEHLKSKPMPTVLAEFKNHPLYALKKDLLKFEAIYPPDTQPIGHIGRQRHEVFPRSAVHKLEGSLNWVKESRSIKAGQMPYKIVSARPKLNIPKEKREPLTLDLFGYWQTEPYVPPEVGADGRIPRNEFGNIYMYKREMLPKGCVHLRLAGIYLIARRLDLEAVPAVVGWEFSGGFNHPILDGCVVLQKDEETLRSAWAEMAREKAIKAAKRVSERIWKNWRRLIRGKVRLEQIRAKFGATVSKRKELQ